MTYTIKNPCSVGDCERNVFARGICQFHYNREKAGIPFDQPMREFGRKQCILPDCDKNRTGNGYCARHYQRFRKYGSPHLPDKQVGPEHPKWSGGVHVSSEGYVIRRIYPGDPLYPEDGDGLRHSIPEHRYVMGNHLGRRLLSEENVHHINGDKQDNRLENLELWSTSQPKGQRLEDKLAWARELIKQYEQLSH